MKNIYKIMSVSIVSVIMTLSSITGVSAATHLGYSATVSTGGQKQTIITTTANTNYTWALNYLTSIEGGKLISMYYTLYGGISYVEAGGNLQFLASQDGYSAIWIPTGVNGVPLVFGDYPITGECSGKNTNSYYCAISGYKYRLYHQNNSPNSVNVSGQFTFTER